MSSIIKVNTYQDANGNALFSSDGSGNVTLSSANFKMVPAFHAYLNSNQNVSPSTETKVQFNATTLDTDSAFDTSNNRFTVPTGKGGEYFLRFSVRISDDTSGRYIRLFKNGSNHGSIGAIAYGTSGYTASLSASGIITASAGDYFEVYGIHYAGGTEVFEGYNNWYQCNFSGFKIIGA